MDRNPGPERLTGALLDRINHHIRILEMNGYSYRLVQVALERPVGPPRKIANAASRKLRSGYALPTFLAGGVKWPSSTPPSGRLLRRRHAGGARGFVLSPTVRFTLRLKCAKVVPIRRDNHSLGLYEQMPITEGLNLASNCLVEAFAT